MKESASGELKPPNKWERNQSETLSKWKTMTDDPSSRPFSFSHGYILFRSKLLTVIAQGFLIAVAVGLLLGIGDVIGGYKHTTWIHFLQFRIPLVNLWLIISTAILLATDTAFLLAGARYRNRRTLFTIALVVVLIVPGLLFHWDK